MFQYNVEGTFHFVDVGRSAPFAEHIISEELQWYVVLSGWLSLAVVVLVWIAPSRARFCFLPSQHLCFPSSLFHPHTLLKLSFGGGNPLLVRHLLLSKVRFLLTREVQIGTLCDCHRDPSITFFSVGRLAWHCHFDVSRAVVNSAVLRAVGVRALP